MGTVPIEITSSCEKWRYRCPNGHTTWEPTNNHLWCRACSQQIDIDHEFWELYDSKTDELIPREEVILHG